MNKHETADHDRAAGPQSSVETARDNWLDRALEDSFPASDPIAARQFD